MPLRSRYSSTWKLVPGWKVTSSSPVTSTRGFRRARSHRSARKAAMDRRKAAMVLPSPCLTPPAMSSTQSLNTRSVSPGVRS